tara:strand:- start:814 stop:978 length:165 start_codon:yes stop_codon:yes gene_type:complete
MPYAIRKRDGAKPFKVVNSGTGDVKGSHATREGAEAQMRLLRGIEHGWLPTWKK